MNHFIKLGNYIFDYIILSLLMFISGLMVLPLYAMILGGIAFFENDLYKNIFQVIRLNIKHIVYLTMMVAFIGFMIILVVQFKDTGILGIFNMFVLILLSVLMTLLIIYPPIILIKMTVTFKGLIQNTLYLAIRQAKYTLMMFFLTGLLIYLSIYAIWSLLLFVPWLQSVSYLSNKALENEKYRREKGEKK